VSYDVDADENAIDHLAEVPQPSRTCLPYGQSQRPDANKQQLCTIPVHGKIQAAVALWRQCRVGCLDPLYDKRSSFGRNRIYGSVTSNPSKQLADGAFDGRSGRVGLDAFAVLGKYPLHFVNVLQHAALQFFSLLTLGT
jgi:hypothetical protein